ncbi:MAG: type II toxin-antitoxin system VapB family antitoxin [Nocardioidaceae bacterium]
MALNIKNEQAQRLSRELAELTGESLTTAVTVALRERLERVRKDQLSVEERVQLILELGRQIAESWRPGAMTVEDLYDDETGLPK